MAQGRARRVEQQGRAPRWAGATPHGVDAPVPGHAGAPLPIDPWRHVVFPNRVRERRIAAGHPKLLPFAALLPDIPYIRLSKIERGEVVARAEELRRIAATLRVAPADLLADVAAPGFDIAAWSAPFVEGAAADDAAEARVAVLLAAAVRARRADPALDTARIVADFGLAPVILSRIEHAQKGLSRWSREIVDGLCRLLEVADEAALRRQLEDWYRRGLLDRTLAEIPGPAQRRERTRERIAALAGELRRERVAPPARIAAATGGGPIGFPVARRLAVSGMPTPDGAIAAVATGESIDAPDGLGARGFALKVCRASLGPGLPGQATLVADPDRRIQPGGLALLREDGGGGWRLLAVSVDRSGALIGHSLNPEREIALDAVDPADLACVVAARFV